MSKKNAGSGVEDNHNQQLAEDISNRQRIEDALRESGELYRTLFENTEDGFMLVEPILDETGFSDDFRMLQVNPAWEQQTGLKAVDFAGRLIKEAMPEVKPDWPANFAEVARTGTAKHLEAYNANSGRWYDLHAFLYRQGQVGVLFRDITDRKRSEEALRESERKYRELFKNSPIAICEIDPIEERFISVNNAGCDMSGYSRDELLAMNLREILDEENHKNFAQRTAEYLDGKLPAGEAEYKITGKNGREIWVLLNTRFRTDDNGRPISNTVFGRDITERKRAEGAAQNEKMMSFGINRILHDALFCDSEEELGMTCLNVALELTGSSIGFINEINAEGLLDGIAISEMAWEACRMPHSKGRRILPSRLNIRGIYGQVILEGKSLLTNHPATHQHSTGLPVGHTPLDSFLGTPLRQNGQVIGLIALGNKKGGFSGQDIIIAEALSPAIVEVLMRKRAEAALRESEDRQAFLLKLSDAIRPLGNPITVLETASRMTGEHLGATRVVYIEIDEDPEMVVVERDWARAGVPSAVGRYHMNDFGTFVSELLRAGLPVIVEDAANDPRISSTELINWELVNTRALISSPLIKEGHLVAYLGVYNDQSHHWTKGESELITEIAERTWAAVERARAEEELRKSRDQLEDKVAERTKELSLERQRLFEVLDTMPNSIILLDPDYHFRFTNRAHRQKHGVPDGRCCYEFIFGLDKPCEDCESFIPLQTGQAHHYEFRDPDDNIIAVHDYPFTDVDGTTLILEISDDITEQRKFEKEMARLDRLNLIGEMAAGIGHEIRNPMTSVRGFLQILGANPKYQEEASVFELMIEELDRANAIITEYLGMAKDKRVDLQPRSLDYLVTALYPMIMSDANLRGINLRLELNNPPEPLIDVNEIRQLILNMVRNGMEAMGEQGNLTIGTAQQGDEVVLYIEDQGHGIPPEISDKLDVPFFTTKDNGTGLGLAVCYSIAARHHARIDYETSPEGTTFYVRFPIESEQGLPGVENNGSGGATL